MEDKKEQVCMYSLSGAMQFDDKFQTMHSVSNPHAKMFEEFLGYMKPVIDVLSPIALEGDLYSSVRLMAVEDDPTLYDMCVCVELSSNTWLIDGYPEEEPNNFSLDIRILTEEEGKLIINGVPEGFTQVKSHWCTKMQADDASVLEDHIKDINAILAAITSLTFERKGFISGTDLLHCIFSFPYNGKVVSITATSEKVIIV